MYVCLFELDTNTFIPFRGSNLNLVQIAEVAKGQLGGCCRGVSVVVELFFYSRSEKGLQVYAFAYCLGILGVEVLWVNVTSSNSDAYSWLSFHENSQL